MRVEILLKNPTTNEIKRVKLGFSWILLFWAGVLGLPLFFRKLHVWGVIMLVLWLVNMALQSTATDPALILGLSLLIIGVQIFLGVKGNELTAKNYLENGWQFHEPESDLTKIAKQKWRLAG